MNEAQLSRGEPRTICHTQAHIVDRLPVGKCLFNGSFASAPAVVTVWIVIVFDEVSDEELVGTLRAKNETQCEGVEHAPGESMEEVKSY